MALQKGIAFKDLATIGTLFVIVGVVIGVGAYMNDQIAETAYTDATVEMEPRTFTDNTTPITFTYPYIKSVEAVYNASTATATSLILSGNYTVYETAILCCGTLEPINGTIFINYTTWNTTLYPDILITKNATSGMGTLSSWLPIVAIVIAAAVVIGVVATYFVRKEGV